MAALGGDKDHPIEISSTDDEVDAVHETTTESELMSLAEYLRQDSQTTPKAGKNVRHVDSATPQASLRSKQASASPIKGKQRATTQICPLPSNQTIYTIDSDEDRKPSPPSRSQPGPSSQRRASSPFKPPRVHRRHQALPSGAPGSWENPEAMVFSDGHVVPRSSASESERPPSRGNRTSRKASGSHVQPTRSIPSDSSALHNSQVMPSGIPIRAETHTDPGQDAIEKEPLSVMHTSNTVSVLKRSKRRPSPPSPHPDASLSRNKHARLDLQAGEASTGPTSIPTKRLVPTWRTHTASPAPPLPVDPSPQDAQAMELDDINQVSAALGEDLPLDQPGSAPSGLPVESAAGPPVIVPPMEPLRSTHDGAVEATRESTGPIIDNNLSTGSAPSLNGLVDTANPGVDHSFISDIAIVPLPFGDFDVIMNDVIQAEPEPMTTGFSERETPTAQVSEPTSSRGVTATIPPSDDLSSPQELQAPLSSASDAQHRPSSPQMVERAVESVREGVADVDINAASRRDKSRSPSFEEISSEVFLSTLPTGSSAKRSPVNAKQDPHTKLEPSLLVGEEPAPIRVVNLLRYENMSRSEWRSLVEKETPVENGLSTGSDTGSPSSSRSTIQKLDDQLYVSITGQPTEPTQQPPEDRRGVAMREFNSAQIDEWNRRAPFLTHNPALHRRIFEAFIAEKELNGGISVSNDVDNEGAPPDFEFEYSNDMLYHPDVPDPEKSLGCTCDGPCDPKAGCSCVRRQEAYFGNLGLEGFAYDANGLAKLPAATIWECSDSCGCPPSCPNRVIQHGRKRETKIEVFKTRNKGWGVRAKAPIPSGQFIGIYSGELITEIESEKRGVLYDEIDRTYIFDLDGWHLRNPPVGLDKIDSRLAETAASTAQRANEVQAAFDEDDECYSAYSVDAFHYGYTRYFNHSCDPNLEIAQCYVYDFHPERPLLCIFTRRQIKYNEEMCISYKGIPDDLPVLPTSPRNGRKGKGGKMNWTKAHVSHQHKALVKPAKHPCFCKSWNCDGSMFH